MSLVEVENLSVAFGAKRVVDGVSFTPGARRDPGAGRRIRFRQVGHRAVAAAASAVGRQQPHRQHHAERPADDGRRCRHAAPRARRARGHRVPGADDQPQPAAPHRPPGRRGDHAASTHPRSQPARTCDRRARPGRLRRCREPTGGVSASALRRPAPARHDRDGARQQSGVADRRRTDHRLGRHHPGADPEAADAAQDGTRGWRCC